MNNMDLKEFTDEMLTHEKVNLTKVEELLRSKWKKQILFALYSHDSLSLDEMKALNLHSSASSLKRNLNSLVSDGLICMEPAAPENVRYMLTESGLEFLSVFYHIYKWQEKYNHDAYRNMYAFAQRYYDTPFSVKTFGDIDALLLAQMSYYTYHGTTSGKSEFLYPISSFLQNDSSELTTGFLTMDDDHILIQLIKNGGRHGNLRVANHVTILDEEAHQQFSAITYRINKDEYYIAYRGTDNTINGWQEDFHMSFLPEIPSQKTAVQYATDMMKRYRGKFYLGGHSKGGNLAVYAAALLEPKLQQRLIRVYNFDGPGFFNDFYQKEGYHRIRDIIYKYVPQSSVIGLLLEEEENYMVIESTASNLLQHNPYTWVVNDDSFNILDSIDDFATIWKTSIDQWL
ncbi:MAG: Mbeg1-like protein, partial [Dorea sp.]